MTSPLEMKKSSRVHSGLAPELYDRVDFTYPTSTTTVMTYSFDEVSAVPVLAGIIQLTYLDASRTQLVSKIRIS